MQNLTQIDLARALPELGVDLSQAEEVVRFLASGASGIYRVTTQQQQQLEMAAELIRLASLAIGVSRTGSDD